MSALPLKADITQRIEHVRYVPIADIRDKAVNVRVDSGETEALPSLMP
jgi:hypothetical protein